MTVRGLRHYNRPIYACCSSHLHILPSSCLPQYKVETHILVSGVLEISQCQYAQSNVYKQFWTLVRLYQAYIGTLGRHETARTSTNYLYKTHYNSTNIDPI